VLAAGPDGYLFGVDDRWDLLSIAVDADGLVEKRHEGLLPGGSFRLVYDDGFLFTHNGRIFDVSSPQAPKLTGSFPSKGFVLSHTGDSSVIQLSFVSAGSSASSPIPAPNGIVLRRLDRSTLEEHSNIPLDGRYMNIVEFVEPVPGVFAFIDYQPVGFSDVKTVRSAVVLASVPEFAEWAR
jgi:hypothetical protein